MTTCHAAMLKDRAMEASFPLGKTWSFNGLPTFHRKIFSSKFCFTEIRVYRNCISSRILFAEDLFSSKICFPENTFGRNLF